MYNWANDDISEKYSKEKFFLDKAMAFAIVLLVFNHAALAYIPGVYWDYKSITQSLYLIPFMVVNNSFLMGLFFVISSFKIQKSLSNGIENFINQRLLKLGIPILFGFFIMIPLQQYFSFVYMRNGESMSFFQYYLEMYFGFGQRPEGARILLWPEANFAHLWLLQYLIVFSLGYVAFLLVFKNFEKKSNYFFDNVPDLRHFSGLIILVTIFGGLVRLFYPLNTWISVLGFLQVEPARIPFFISIFVFSILFTKNSWLESISEFSGEILFKTGILLVLFFFFLGIFVQVNNDILTNFLPYFESVMGMCLVIGIVLFLRNWDTKNSKAVDILSKNALPVFVIHVPILIFYQFFLDNLPIGLFLRFLLAGVLTIVTSLLISITLITRWLNTQDHF